MANYPLVLHECIQDMTPADDPLYGNMTVRGMHDEESDEGIKLTRMSNHTPW